MLQTGLLFNDLLSNVCAFKYVLFYIQCFIVNNIVPFLVLFVHFPDLVFIVFNKDLNQNYCFITSVAHFHQVFIQEVAWNLKGYA